MRSKLLGTTLRALALCTFLSTTGCGVFGEKNKPEADSSVGNKGCLNDSKDLMNRYLLGEISEKQWRAAFDCVDESLAFFTEYVRGSKPDAYTQADMYTLVTKFLLTNKHVNRDLMSGAFSLKAALFGGGEREFRKDEFDLLKKSLTRLRDITMDLIPYLKLRQQANPRLEDVLEMTTAFKRAGDQLADFVTTLPTGFLTQEALVTLVNELSKSLEIPLIENLGEKIFLAKWMIFNTRRDAIEVADWPQFFKTTMGLSGLLIAFKTAAGPSDPNDPDKVFKRLQNDYRFREFMWELMMQVKPYIQESLAKHGGITPFPLFDHLIDELPDDMINNIPKKTVKETIRPLFRKFLASDTKMGVDQKVIDTVYGVVDEIIKNMGMLDRFYEKTGLDENSVTEADMKAALAHYWANLPNGEEQKRFAKVMAAVTNYKPQFLRDTGYIYYDKGIGYSKWQTRLTVAFEPFVNHFIRTYASGDGYFIESDFRGFMEEYSTILFALKFIDPTVPSFGAKRFKDMDLFTYASDGNQQVRLAEMVNYGMAIISASKMTTKMRDEITPICNANDGTDIMDWTLVDPKCFRRQFHDRLTYWIEGFPHLKKYWNSMNAAQQAKAMIWLEHGARREGYRDDKLGKFDFGSLATVLHYTETMFSRFDTNNDQGLVKQEINEAYPVFKNLISKQATIASGNNYILKGVFTYIVKYQSMPDTTNFNDITKLAWWLIRYTGANYTSDRSGIFNIVCQLALPERFTDPKEAAKVNRTVCAP